MIYLNIGSNLPLEEGGRETNILKAINYLKNLNYQICPKSRRQGYAAKMLKLSIKKIKMFWGKKQIYAYVKHKNIKKSQFILRYSILLYFTFTFTFAFAFTFGFTFTFAFTLTFTLLLLYFYFYFTFTFKFTLHLILLYIFI